ncbi:hypothetical protein BB31_42470 [Amycolatopsis lurida NRRL 2430]|uniref:VOC domain-containing protein n=1 Tax=Amycolatopsis lurida NRRL 2430 TaxID=1460371 RepID=A0A2P2FEX3_AMYLU|nr:hypothetical protein BB31_42470 [Amycolatopsis lurida NRRL 2430]
MVPLSCAPSWVIRRLLLFDKFTEQRVDIEAGPVRRTGVRSTIYSLHLRDPDGNLIKLSNYFD